MRISDWSSDVCSSDLTRVERAGRIAQYPTQCHRGVGAEARGEVRHRAARQIADRLQSGADERGRRLGLQFERGDGQAADRLAFVGGRACLIACKRARGVGGRSEARRGGKEWGRGVDLCGTRMLKTKNKQQYNN